MAEGKSRGLTFAEKQLLCHGWEHGKGLGRAENGISEAIKVKVKSDKAGVGHKEGDQFTFHWWDHVFNKASSSLQVETDQNGVQVKKNLDTDEGGMISNKKPLKASLSKEKLYGCFVKSATLLSGQEQPEPKSSPSDSSSSSSEDEEEHKLDLSSTTNLSDADLMMACGGRTAHKGARYGLTMSAKLARLEQQEAEFMAKYGKKNQSPLPFCATPALQSADREEPEEDSMRKMVKKKKLTEIVYEQSEETGSNDGDSRSKKKKNKRRRVEDKIIVPAEGGEICVATIKKCKKKKAEEEQIKDGRTLSSEDLHPERKTKKKKSSKHQCEVKEKREMESTQSELVQDSVSNRKKKKSKKQQPTHE